MPSSHTLLQIRLSNHPSQQRAHVAHFGRVGPRWRQEERQQAQAQLALKEEQLAAMRDELEAGFPAVTPPRRLPDFSGRANRIRPCPRATARPRTAALCI